MSRLGAAAPVRTRRVLALAAAAGVTVGSAAPAVGQATRAAPGGEAPAPAVAADDTVRVLVAYDSETGHTARMAAAAAEGAARVPGVAVTLRRVIDVTADELAAADGVIVGSPTHWANMSAPVNRFLDTWPDMVDKVGGAFATGGAPTGGKEQVIVSLLLGMLNHGMVVVGPVYEEDGFRFGSFGASAVTGPASAGVDEVGLDEARRLGGRVAEAAVRLRRGG